MNRIISKLEAHESKTPSRWREAAEYRQANKSWLRHSQRIAMLMLDKMDELHLTQTELAQRMGCSHCARGLHIAGPFERFSIRNWIAV